MTALGANKITGRIAGKPLPSRCPWPDPAGTVITPVPRPLTGAPMNMTLSLAPLVSLIAGILILVVPRLLNYIVAIYLIVIGLLGLFGAGTVHLK
jgi:hypothetical protein